MNAFIIVDVQNDFCPGGALAVPDGDQVVPVINELLPAFDTVVCTQDWHPLEHGSFATNHPGKVPGEVIELDGLPQILWPVHCVQDSPGAEFHPGLDASGVEMIFRKGMDPAVDSYSGFFDNGRRHATGLEKWLRARGVEAVYICGLATDYCVKWTALDALKQGFVTYVITDACRGVDLNPGDSSRALLDLARAGAHLITSAQVPGQRW